MAEGPTFEALILRAKAGDKDAFGELYETHLTPVYRYIYARVRDKGAAEDIAQETFLKAYQALQSFEATVPSFLPYLFTIARNLLINHGKKKRPGHMEHEEIDRVDGGMSADQGARNREDGELLLLLLDGLTETEREIIELRFYGERSYEEISDATGKTEDAIRQHVARAMKKMRASMKDKGYENNRP